MQVRKKLYRNIKEKKIAGVCAGFADYFNIDVALIRIVWVLFTFLGGAGIITYLISIILVPKKREEDKEIIEVRKTNSVNNLYLSRSNKIFFGVCGGIGEYFNIDPVIIRIIFLLLIFAYGFTLILYIILALIIPKKPE